MAEPALRRWTVDDFLEWDDGTSQKYQLIHGTVVAMSPARQGHRRIAVNLATRLQARLRPPCFAEIEAGIRLSHRDDTYYLADVAVTCAPPTPNQCWTPDPVLIVEVLSPSTQREDWEYKLPDYQRLASVMEILLIASQGHRADIWRRDGEEWRHEVVNGPEEIRFTSFGFAVPLADLYRDTGIAG